MGYCVDVGVVGDFYCGGNDGWFELCDYYVVGVYVWYDVYVYVVYCLGYFYGDCVGVVGVFGVVCVGYYDVV